MHHVGFKNDSEKSNRLLLKYFVAELKSELYKQVHSIRPTKLDQALTIAVQFENEVIAVQQEDKQKKHGFMYNET
jgi:hypothetical protein